VILNNVRGGGIAPGEHRKGGPRFGGEHAGGSQASRGPSRSLYMEMLIEIPPFPEPKRGLTTWLFVEPKVKLNPTLK